MALVLSVDGERWRAHLREVAARTPGLVPVAKGNGYGFGLVRLARKATWLGTDTLAVGTYEELPEVADRYDGDLLVLTPWRSFAQPTSPSAILAPKHTRRVVHTVGRMADLAALLAQQPDSRLVLERLTSMRRHGFDAAGFAEAAALLRKHPGAQLRGVALHLPLAAANTIGQSHFDEVRRLLSEVAEADLPQRSGATQLWVSHLTTDELTDLRATYPDWTVRPRIGTDLWLGARDALRATATVLDVHPIRKGERFGYRGRPAPDHGHLVVVSGGTAHGIGLESPLGESSLKARAATVARGGLDAFGIVRSPFWVDGKQRRFAEAPHMQASILFLPSGARAPAVGDLVDARVRYTATTFDRVDLG